MADDVKAPLPEPPAERHPMRANQWPSQEVLPPVDLAEVDKELSDELLHLWRNNLS